jgi:alkanesulfonate monooxygenase SsuD/methylene tetrahydromethanopterin reductase-like flavin-dependent oxidoreductase (luciferase family)
VNPTAQAVPLALWRRAGASEPRAGHEGPVLSTLGGFADMRCGVAMTAMNYTAWPAFDHWEETGEWSTPPVPDHQVVREDVELGLLAASLGFDSLWTVEHHVTPYNMITNTLQWLTYFAGATSNVDFGTMVVVLPWHHPLRVAEDIAMLHNLLGAGRRLTVGRGRGAARREFRALGIPMDESRDRFLEALEIVRRALSQEVFEFQRPVLHDPTDLHPAATSRWPVDRR